MNKETPNFLVPAPPDPGFPSKYEEEKKNGTRRPNGATFLKRLTAKHKEMIKMHLSGLTNNNIAEAANRSYSSVSLLLSDPLALAEISRLLEDTEKEFQALYPKSVECIRDAMEANTIANTPAHTTRLKAVDIYYRANGKYRDADSGAESAEDVIERILALPAIQVNINIPAKDTPVSEPINGEFSYGSENTD